MMAEKRVDGRKARAVRQRLKKLSTQIPITYWPAANWMAAIVLRDDCNASFEQIAEWLDMSSPGWANAAYRKGKDARKKNRSFGKHKVREIHRQLQQGVS